MLAIIDYGMGNVRSVINAFEALDAPVVLTSDVQEIDNAKGIILPGVGAIGNCIAAISERNLFDILKKKVIEDGTPFLGLCVGMQMLASRGNEHGSHEALGFIPGTVDLMKIPQDRPDVQLPHIGWNTVRFLKKDGLYSGMGDQADFYFVHSYAMHPESPEVISGECDHGTNFVASIEYENIWATQFHPEKSHKNGLALLSNFIRRTTSC